MAMYTDIQKKAQAEIDAVIGCNRLPDLDDLDYLPFIETVVKETLRWQPAIPMGMSPTNTGHER
jgi:cytochrome P450